MAEYIHAKLPKNCRVIATSDWHVGGKTFHEKAAQSIVDRLVEERNTYCLFNGDFIEGKRIDSPHFDPRTLNDGQTMIGAQLEYARELIRPSAKKWLGIGLGNHDVYVKEAELVKHIVAEPLGIPIGGYQTWYDFGNGVRVHAYHGRATMPRGAKDPIQRKANQRAWLKNRLESLAGDCHVQLMGHCHDLVVQQPLKQYALLSDTNGNVRAHNFEQPVSMVDGKEYIPPESRWYGMTGTLRRSGGFGFVDYGEVGGFAPLSIGHLEVVIEKGKVVDIEEVRL